MRFFGFIFFIVTSVVYRLVKPGICMNWGLGHHFDIFPLFLQASLPAAKLLDAEKTIVVLQGERRTLTVICSLKI
jgi:hypothetical protein